VLTKSPYEKNQRHYPHNTAKGRVQNIKIFLDYNAGEVIPENFGGWLRTELWEVIEMAREEAFADSMCIICKDVCAKADKCGIGDLQDGVDDESLQDERRECIMNGGFEV
jgi:hypothetical protein